MLPHSALGSTVANAPKKREPAEPVPGQLLYGVIQAARVLGISERACWTYIRRGELKSRRLGARRLVPRRELERFAQQDHDGVGEVGEP